VFRSPTLIGVGEAGPETVSVTPVGRGGGATLTVHFHGPVYGDRRAITDTVRQGLKEALRREGKGTLAAQL
jgi:hypothetical protein